MHTNLILWFNPLNTQVRTLLIKVVVTSTNVHGMPTFKTEVLRLIRVLQHLNHLILLNELLTQHNLSLRFVTKAKPTNSINSIFPYNETRKRYNLYNQLFRLHLM